MLKALQNLHPQPQTIIEENKFIIAFVAVMSEEVDEEQLLQYTNAIWSSFEDVPDYSSEFTSQSSEPWTQDVYKQSVPDIEPFRRQNPSGSQKKGETRKTDSSRTVRRTGTFA